MATREFRKRPLPPGTAIEHLGVAATVIQDKGGDTLEVLSDGFIQTWQWVFEGAACRPLWIEPEASELTRLRIERDALHAVLMSQMPGLTVTRRLDGALLAITCTDEDNRILEVLWEAAG